MNKNTKKVNKAKTQSPAKQKASKTDIIDLILKDHKPIWKLIKTLKSEKASYTTKKATFDELAPTLVAHAKPEEQTWYLSMKQEHDMNQEGLEGDVEHSLADQLCDELKSEGKEDLFMAKVKVLAELVEHHLEEEEEELLPQFKKDSNAEERSQLGVQYLELQAQLKDENSVPSKIMKAEKGNRNDHRTSRGLTN